MAQVTASTKTMINLYHTIRESLIDSLGDKTHISVLQKGFPEFFGDLQVMFPPKRGMNVDLPTFLEGYCYVYETYINTGKVTLVGTKPIDWEDLYKESMEMLKLAPVPANGHEVKFVQEVKKIRDAAAIMSHARKIERCLITAFGDSANQQKIKAECKPLYCDVKALYEGNKKINPVYYLIGYMNIYEVLLANGGSTGAPKSVLDACPWESMFLKAEKLLGFKTANQAVKKEYDAIGAKYNNRRATVASQIDENEDEPVFVHTAQGNEEGENEAINALIYNDVVVVGDDETPNDEGEEEWVLGENEGMNANEAINALIYNDFLVVGDDETPNGDGEEDLVL